MPQPITLEETFSIAKQIASTQTFSDPSNQGMPSLVALRAFEKIEPTVLELLGSIPSSASRDNALALHLRLGLLHQYGSLSDGTHSLVPYLLIARYYLEVAQDPCQHTRNLIQATIERLNKYKSLAA
jgi:hypothetical protein